MLYAKQAASSSAPIFIEANLLQDEALSYDLCFKLLTDGLTNEERILLDRLKLPPDHLLAQLLNLKKLSQQAYIDNYRIKELQTTLATNRQKLLELKQAMQSEIDKLNDDFFTYKNARYTVLSRQLSI